MHPKFCFDTGKAEIFESVLIDRSARTSNRPLRALLIW